MEECTTAHTSRVIRRARSLILLSNIIMPNPSKYIKSMLSHLPQTLRDIADTDGDASLDSALHRVDVAKQVSEMGVLCSVKRFLVHMGTGLAAGLPIPFVYSVREVLNQCHVEARTTIGVYFPLLSIC